MEEAAASAWRFFRRNSVKAGLRLARSYEVVLSDEFYADEPRIGPHRLALTLDPPIFGEVQRKRRGQTHDRARHSKPSPTIRVVRERKQAGCVRF